MAVAERAPGSSLKFQRAGVIAPDHAPRARTCSAHLSGRKLRSGKSRRVTSASRPAEQSIAGTLQLTGDPLLHFAVESPRETQRQSTVGQRAIVGLNRVVTGIRYGQNINGQGLAGNTCPSKRPALERNVRRQSGGVLGRRGREYVGGRLGRLEVDDLGPAPWLLLAGFEKSSFATVPRNRPRRTGGQSRSGPGLRSCPHRTVWFLRRNQKMLQMREVAPRTVLIPQRITATNRPTETPIARIRHLPLFQIELPSAWQTFHHRAN